MSRSMHFNQLIEHKDICMFTAKHNQNIIFNHFHLWAKTVSDVYICIFAAVI